MNAEIICVGTELLLGNILNTNARYLSQKMAELGFNVFSQSVVGDNSERLKNQLGLSLKRSDVVILCGGLGPTEDDITKETVAAVMNRKLIMDEQVLNDIQEYFLKQDRSMSESNRKQAFVIDGAVILKNHNGTAPGFIIEDGGRTVVLLPGPPSELVPMFEKQAEPYFKTKSNQTIISHNVRVFGVGESLVAECCGELLDGNNPTVATYAKTGEVDIRVTARAKKASVAETACRPVIEQLKSTFKENIYGIDCDSLQRVVVNLLKVNRKKLATAESCTAGMLSSRITQIPGSSDVFEMGVTAYADYIKIQALGVSDELIEQLGAVSPEVAAEMAIGIRTMCNADIGIGITGVAGPESSENKPVGLVFIALADRKKVYVRKIMCKDSDREAVRITASSTALDMVRRYLENCKSLISFGTEIGTMLHVVEGYAMPVPKSKAMNTQTGSLQRGNNAGQNTAAAEKTNPVISDKKAYEIMKMVTDSQSDELPGRLNIKNDALPFFVEDTALQAHDDKSAKAVTESKKSEPKNKKSFFKSVFPCKGDPLSEKLRKTIFIVALLVLLATMGYLINYFSAGFLQNRMNTQAAGVWDTDNSMSKNADGIFIGFEKLLAENPDVKAWIRLDGTNINNPVYQTTDNDYYINHNMKKQSSRYGALFADCKNTISAEKNSKNIIIYGHHMKDGTMFGTLKKYLQVDFYKEHSVLDFTTLYRDGKYKVFSVFITNTRPEHDNGEVFNYRQIEFSDDAEFLNWVNEVKIRSIIDTGVNVEADDEILTLSTCTYEFDDARLVVMARRIRDDEGAEIYGTENAKLNPNPLYPQIWYSKKGIKKPNFDSLRSSSVTSVTVDESEPSSSSSPDVSSSSYSTSASSVMRGNVSSGSKKASTTGNHTSSVVTKPQQSSSNNSSTSSKPSGSSTASDKTDSKISSTSTPASSSSNLPEPNTSSDTSQ